MLDTQNDAIRLSSLLSEHDTTGVMTSLRKSLFGAKSGDRSNSTDAAASTLSRDPRGAAPESRDRWRDMVQFAADMVFETDETGRFVYLWPPTVLGWSAAVLLGSRGATLLAHPDDDPDPFAKDTRLRGDVARLRCRDGRIVALSFASAPATLGPRAGTGGTETGTRGFATFAASTCAGRAAAPWLATMPAMLWRMRAQLLPTPMIQTALHDLLDLTGAEGAALLQTSAPGEMDLNQSTLFADFPNATFSPRMALRHTIGSMPKDWLESLTTWSGEFAACRPQLVPTTPWVHATTVSERPLLVCGAPDMVGNAAALAVWRARDGERWSEDTVAVVSIVSAITCITLEQDQLAREINRQTRGDALTGLLAREAFQEEVERRFDRLDRGGLPGTLLFADLQGFRAINDRFGPERGDAILRQTALMLRDAVRASDLVGRQGGDIFALWLDSADRFAAAERADHLCRGGASWSDAPEALDSTVTNALPVLPPMAIGMALRAPRSFETFESLAQRAQAALLDAKAKHRRGAAAWTMATDEPPV